jgi:hypothetical protein
MMCSKRFLIVVILATMVAGSITYAEDTYFAAIVDHNFFNADNWLYDLPDEEHDAVLNAGPDYYAVIYDTPGSDQEVPYTIHEMHLGRYDEHKMNTLTMQAGGLYMPGDTPIHSGPSRLVVGGLFTNDRGTLNMDGGGIAAMECWVGITDTGIVNMNGGTLDTWDRLNVGAPGYPGSGTINLNDGLVRTTRLFMGGPNPSIIITNGTLDVWNAFCNYDIQNVLDYITNGWIVAGNGYVLQTEIYTNDCSGQGIRVTAVGGDIDGDGDVDMEDLAWLAANWLSGT